MRIVLTDGQGITGAYIRWYTWSWAAHAGIRLDDGTIIDATPGAGVSHHANVAGTIRRTFDVRGLTPEIEAKALNWLKAQLGKPYDWSAIAGMAFRRDWHNPTKWFCSELVVGAFEFAGLPLLETGEVDRISPRDLTLSPLLIPHVEVTS